jgi:hypothetical protein
MPVTSGRTHEKTGVFRRFFQRVSISIGATGLEQLRKHREKRTIRDQAARNPAHIALMPA